MLLLVYRNPETDLSLNPLRRIVVYDGLKRKPDLVTTITQTLRGFYGSSSATLAEGVAKARITHIAASGQPNANERIMFNDSTNTHDREQSVFRCVVFRAVVRKPDLRRELV